MGGGERNMEVLNISWFSPFIFFFFKCTRKGEGEVVSVCGWWVGGSEVSSPTRVRR